MHDKPMVMLQDITPGNLLVDDTSGDGGLRLLFSDPGMAAPIQLLSDPKRCAPPTHVDAVQRDSRAGCSGSWQPLAVQAQAGCSHPTLARPPPPAGRTACARRGRGPLSRCTSASLTPRPTCSR